MVGFMFNSDSTRVLLLHKQSPLWQRGRLNGVGGKMEPGETIGQAMVREFLEETGVATPRRIWMAFATLAVEGAGPTDGIVHFLAAFDDDAYRLARSVTEEPVVPVHCDQIFLRSTPEPGLHELQWLIPLARDSAARRYLGKRQVSLIRQRPLAPSGC